VLQASPNHAPPSDSLPLSPLFLAHHTITITPPSKPSHTPQAVVLSFDQQHELLWAGEEREQQRKANSSDDDRQRLDILCSAHRQIHTKPHANPQPPPLPPPSPSHHHKGAASGMMYTLQSSTLEPYAAWKAHTGSIHSVTPLSEGCALSVSSDALSLHTAGGVLRMCLPQQQRKAGGQDAAAEAPVEVCVR